MNLYQFYKIAPVTLLLMGVIIGYFVIQIFMGVSIDNPSNRELLRFGANFLPMTIIEPWRLLSAGFIHIGLMHLLFNSFALYYFGQVAEIMLGRVKFFVLFVLSIIGGNILTLYQGFYHYLETGSGLAISAGASGGIMGIGASLIALSFSPHPFAKNLNKKSLLMVMAINLMMGFAVPNIDNAGHIGGAIVGLLLGVVFGYLPKLAIIGIGVISVALGVSFWLLKSQVLTMANLY